MRLLIVVIAIGFFSVAESHAQTFCTEYSNGTIYCDGPDRSRIISPTGPDRGVIMDTKNNFDTYSIQRNRRAEEDRRDDERRRALIYGEDRRDSRDSRRSYDYGEEYGR